MPPACRHDVGFAGFRGRLPGHFNLGTLAMNNSMYCMCTLLAYKFGQPVGRPARQIPRASAHAWPAIRPGMWDFEAQKSVPIFANLQDPRQFPWRGFVYISTSGRPRQTSLQQMSNYLCSPFHSDTDDVTALRHRGLSFLQRASSGAHLSLSGIGTALPVLVEKMTAHPSLSVSV